MESRALLSSFNKSFYLYTALSVAALIVVLGPLIYDSLAEEPEPGVVFSSQSTSRTWESVDLQKRKTASVTSDFIYSARDMAYRNGEFFVSDYGDYKIKVFDKDGKFLRSIGNGSGQAPGQFQSMIGVEVSDSRVWVGDSNQRAIHAFDLSGDYLNSVRIDDMFLRFHHNGDGFTLITVADSLFFRDIDMEGNTVNRYGVLMSNQDQNFMSLYGNFIDRPEGGFIYSTTRASYLFHYDDSGHRTHTVRTLDRIRMKRSKKSATATGHQYQPPSSPVRYYTLTHSGSHLNQFALIMHPDRPWQHAIDQYDLESGTYQGSIEIPDDVTRAHMIGDSIYAISDTSFVIYDIERPAS